MAAYGALVSLSHLLHQILHPPPLFTSIIIIDREQIELLRGKIESLIDFLETYPSRRSEEIADAEVRIRAAAYEAEDIIESNLMDQIHATDLYRRVEASVLSSQENEIYTFSSLEEEISTLTSQIKEISTLSSLDEKRHTLLCEGIERVLEMFISIERELLAVRVMQVDGDLQLKSWAAARSPPPVGKNTMVGFDQHLIEIMSQLATDESSLQIIPVVGMGGIGKTTLTTAVYNHPFIVEHFHFRAWVTVSQEYSVRELLLGLLYGNESNKAAGTDNNELGLKLHKKLFGRKYLIVMDDIWDIQAWDEVKRFLPDNENGSRVLVTSRLSHLAADLGSHFPYKMDFLGEGHSWDLFCKTIFGEEDCPVEFKKIGKNIVKRCSGLPLALVLIGGLLAKSGRTREHWEVFAEDLTSALNFGNDEQVMKILFLSYAHLPVYLKPCFLYLAMFPEDRAIRASWLIKLWVSEGLIKPSQDKCLEDIARDYLEDLVSRNVVLVGKRVGTGNVKHCKLHDLVRDFCVTQAEKEEFVYEAKLVDNPKISPKMNETVRRLSVSTTGKLPERTIKAVGSASLNRSLLSLDNGLIYDVGTMESFRLLKVVHGGQCKYNQLKHLTNLRYVYCRFTVSFFSLALCWNLQTLILRGVRVSNHPPEIWLMPQLRHLKLYSFTLPDPPNDDQNVVILENLQTIKGVIDFKCLEHVVERIPNLRSLGAVYDSETAGAQEEAAKFRLHNLARFKKLESFKLHGAVKVWPTIAFPISLKKLTLCRCCIHWEDLSVIGSLPILEALILIDCTTIGEEWNPVEGQFCRLKLLKLITCDLMIWGAEDYHFPCLECLFLLYIPLKMIPISFSEILTLQQIVVEKENRSLLTSARNISNEREQLGYEPLRIKFH